MRKSLQLPLILLILALYITPATEARVIINNTEIATSTQNMLPLREIIEHIGGTVAWNNAQITIRWGSQVAAITIGSTSATVNNHPVELAIPPRLIEGRTMVSLCFLSDHIGLGAGYKNSTFILSTTPARRIPILTYHHILPDDVNIHFQDNPWTISTEDFEIQMRYLRDNGFYTPTLWELEAFLYYGRPLPHNSIMIHFDDGYYSNYVYAYPILQRYGLRAVIFPVTAQAEALDQSQPPICHDSLTRAAAITLTTGTDVFETASHTHNIHDFIPDTSQSILTTKSVECIVQDILQSFEFVSNQRAFAYPFGQFNDTVIEALQEAGITMAFTVSPGYVTRDTDPFQLNRFTIYRSTTMARFRQIVNNRA